ncbi:hypothetical protein [Sphaerisporangium sp. TRM90804]|uniref:hypothetical protein n=1 Tax=Sphaerisporangium sp. TRM90804 TaxID=3031113 RepID=UPI00244BE31A|nr:hypothetical protein [Sphaerisporangium sp. TRM90804]MDH2426676.1 hypothetical protein [Sphaerisporangium sp. TRM90804]
MATRRGRRTRAVPHGPARPATTTTARRPRETGGYRTIWRVDTWVRHPPGFRASLVGVP